MACTSVRSSASISAACSSSSSAGVSVLRFSGRFRVMRATRSATSKVIVSVDFSHLAMLVLYGRLPCGKRVLEGPDLAERLRSYIRPGGAVREQAPLLASMVSRTVGADLLWRASHWLAPTS